MAKPKIQLSDALQETIESNQEAEFEGAKSKVNFLDNWMSDIITGKISDGWDASERLEILQTLDDMKRDYKSFIVE